MPEGTELDSAQTPEGQTQNSSASQADSGALEQTGFRWGEEAPEELQGKDAAETLEAFQNQQEQYNEVVDAVRSLMSNNQPAYPNQPPAQPAPQTTPLDPDKILTDPESWQRDAMNNIGQVIDYAVQQRTQGSLSGQADNARHLSKSDPAKAAVWEKYGGEIEQLANSQAIDPSLKGSKNFWDKAADVVQANHLDEIVQERAQALAATMGSGVESGGSAGYGSSPEDSDAMSRIRESSWGKKFEHYSDAKIRDVAEKMGGLDKYADMVVGTTATVNPHNQGEWVNRSIARDI